MRRGEAHLLSEEGLVAQCESIGRARTPAVDDGARVQHLAAGKAHRGRSQAFYPGAGPQRVPQRGFDDAREIVGGDAGVAAVQRSGVFGEDDVVVRPACRDQWREPLPLRRIEVAVMKRPGMVAAYPVILLEQQDAQRRAGGPQPPRDQRVGQAAADIVETALNLNRQDVSDARRAASGLA